MHIIETVQSQLVQPALSTTMQCMYRSTGSKSSAFALAETLGALTALQQVCQDGAAASLTAVGPDQAKAPSHEILQVLLEQSISVAGRKAVAVAISAVPGALHRLMALMHVSFHRLWTCIHSAFVYWLCSACSTYAVCPKSRLC